MGSCIHADDCDLGPRPGAAERRLAACEIRRRALHLLRICVPRRAALGSSRRRPPARQPPAPEPWPISSAVGTPAALARGIATIAVLLVATSAAVAQPCLPLQVRNPAGN